MYGIRVFLRRIAVALLVVGLFSVGTAAQAQNDQNLLQVLEADPDFSTFEQALRTARIEDSIAFTDNITLLAPTNEAFAALSQTTRDALLAPQNQTALLEVLRYHVVLSSLEETDLVESPELITLLGADQNVAIGATTEGEVLVNETVGVAGFSTAPVNGSLVVISEVLLPEGFDLNSLEPALTPEPASPVNPLPVTSNETTPRTGGGFNYATGFGAGVLLLVLAITLKSKRNLRYSF